MKKVKSFLEEQNNSIKSLMKKAYFAYYNAITTGKEEFYKEYEKYALEMEDFFHNKENFEKIKDFLKKSNEDPIIKRQLEVLHDSYLGSQGEMDLLKKILEKSTQIEKRFNMFRAKVGEKELTDNEIKDILRKETDSEKLKAAWEGSKKQGEIVEKEILELIKLRNELAKNLGYENYYKMHLELGEQKEEEIEETFEELNNLTKDSFKKIKEEMDRILTDKYKISKEDLKPWHYQDLFFQEGPDIFDLKLEEIENSDVIKISEKFFEEAGLNVKDILEKSDLYEKPGKYQHACCIDLDREGDVRIVQSTKNDAYWAETTLHELGHAVYDKGYVYTDLPFLLKSSAHTFVTEAIALLFERNIFNRTFLEKFYGFNKEKLEKINEDLYKKMKLKQLVFSRWSQVMFNFERELYKNPDQDLNKLWWDLVKKYQMIEFYRDKPDWASKIHIVGAPVYYHNYLLGNVLASQINNYIKEKILEDSSNNSLDYSNKKVGEYLNKEIFEHGQKYKWDKLIEKATGEKLNPKYYSKDFCD
ncbi:MAG: M2 family metallopeptidase [Nanoarchaeota archaeon]|nr:M2 family metallopeptidase [Nanoarchaeota archaeon]